MRPSAAPETTEGSAPPHQLSLLPILGMMVLMWSASVYSAYGISAYPRQEWLVESLASIIFVIPVLNFFKGSRSMSGAVRLVGAMLLLHSVWDALHWPGQALLQTPIDPWIPRLCPFLDLSLGSWLLARGK